MQCLNTYMMGDSGVGKTALVFAYLEKSFTDRSPSIGADYVTAWPFVDGERYRMRLWDSPAVKGCFRRPAALDAINEKIDVFILLFSVEDLQSYNNISAKWISEVKDYSSTTPVILVGNKTDLRERGNEIVTIEMGKQLAHEIKAVAYFECSYHEKRTATIERIFEEAARATDIATIQRFVVKPNKTLFKVYLLGDTNAKDSLVSIFQINDRLNVLNQRLNVFNHRFNKRWHPDYNFAGFSEMDGEECGWVISLDYRI